MAIYLSPAIGTDIIGSSISDTLVKSSVLWNDRSTYFVFFSYAIDSSAYNFTVDIQVS